MRGIYGGIEGTYEGIYIYMRAYGGCRKDSY